MYIYLAKLTLIHGLLPLDHLLPICSVQDGKEGGGPGRLFFARGL